MKLPYPWSLSSSRWFPLLKPRTFTSTGPPKPTSLPRIQTTATRAAAATSTGRIQITRPGVLSLLPGSRLYSTGSSRWSTLTTVLNSRVTFRLANVFYIGLIGTVLLYGAGRLRRKKGKKSQDAPKTQTSGQRSRFENKTVVITGGAGDIGRSTALAFAREGAEIFLVDLPHTKKSLKVNCKELEEEGAKLAEYVLCDVTESKDVKKLVENVVDRAGHIDFFFNNAGVQGALKPLHKQEEKEFKKVINVNIYGVFLGMKYVSEAMIASGKGGVVVNTASLAGLLGPANMAAYAASKFAVVGMTKTAAKDLARHGIRVCAIAPGILEGRMWDTQVRGNAKCRKEIEGDMSELTKEDIAAQERRMIEGTPMRRQGKLSEVASVVTFLCSDDASYLTGVTVPIDGGRIP